MIFSNLVPRVSTHFADTVSVSNYDYYSLVRGQITVSAKWVMECGEGVIW